MPSKSTVVLGAAIAATVLLSTATSAAAAYIVTGANIKDGSVTSADIANGSLTGADIKDGYLTGADIRNGSIGSADLAASALVPGPQGPAGPKGDTGAPGAQGPQGPAGPGPRLISAAGEVPGVVWMDKTGYTRLVGGSLWSFPYDGVAAAKPVGGINTLVGQYNYMQTIYFTTPTCESGSVVLLDAPADPVGGAPLVDGVDMVQGTYVVETVTTLGGPPAGTAYYRLTGQKTALGGTPLYWRNEQYQMGHCTSAGAEQWTGTMYPAVEVDLPAGVGAVTIAVD